MTDARVPGHIRKRGDTWQVIVELEPDPLSGRRRRKSVTAKTKKAAQLARAQLVNEAANGTAQAPERRTVADLADVWLTHIEGSRSPLTMIGYRQKVDGYIVPNIGKVRLDRLRAIQLDGLYTRLQASGGKDGAPLSAQTVRHVHAILHAMLAQARRWGWVVKNPADDATIPEVEPPLFTIPTPDQVAALYDAARFGDTERRVKADRNIALMIWLCAVAGVRRGEACALRWSSITGRSLIISQALVVDGKGVLVIKSTKTRKVRRVSLDGWTMRLLAQHRREARANAASNRAELERDAFVFSETASGVDPLNPDVVSQRFYRLAGAVGIDCHLHLLRHYHDTMLLAAGVAPRIIAGRAGHDTRQVLERYGHFLAASDGHAAEVLSSGMQRGSYGGAPS